MNVKATRAREGENPRTTRVRQIIVDAAIDLLVHHGASAVTATRIAQETGVARTTIYRQWPDPALLLLDTIDTLVAPHRSTTVTESLEADLTTAISNLRTRLNRQPFRQVFAALLDHANRDRAFIAAQRRFTKGVTQPIQDILVAGQQRGDLRANTDIADAVALLCGPIFHQHVMLRTTVDDDLIRATIAQFLNTKDIE